MIKATIIAMLNIYMLTCRIHTTNVPHLHLCLALCVRVLLVVFHYHIISDCLLLLVLLFVAAPASSLPPVVVWRTKADAELCV